MWEGSGKRGHLAVCKLLCRSYSSGPKSRRTAILNAWYASNFNDLSPLDFNLCICVDGYDGETPCVAKAVVTGRIHHKCSPQFLVSTSAPVRMSA
jgi:hypothetical protein